MEETLGYIIQGFGNVLSVSNLLWLFMGGLLGTIIGMLPGIGPATGVAVLIPMTFTMDPMTALMTMCAIYYGAMFGGSRSSILINTPGDGSAIAATFDGYPMAQKGRAGPALAISALASFIGGIIAVFLMTLLAGPMSSFAIKFGPPQYFSLFVFALSATVSISKGSLLKGALAMFIGLMLSTVGIDQQSGMGRFTLGVAELQDGIDFLVAIIGIYAIGEVFLNYESLDTAIEALKKKFGKVWITMDDWKRCFWPIMRSTPVGFIVGVLPGSGGSIASMVAYTNEKQLSKHPDEFGNGAIEGLAAPEAANNAASVGALIPMLTLGVPGSGTTAVMLGALMMMGLQPGPLLFTEHPLLAWSVIDSMYLGNILLAIINIPLAVLIVKVLYVPKRVLLPIILVLAFLGTYTMNYSVVDFYMLLVFGVMGYAMKKLKIPAAPMVLALILGNMMEQAFRQSLTLSMGSLMIFVEKPISLTLLIMALLSTLYPFFAEWRQKRKQQ
ncbi:MAG: tripartite tricarboxylate transporter permease [Synergistales bacterium]|nr:tripartite tricarboxylate transporter permease [Synergistales bacterium]